LRERAGAVVHWVLLQPERIDAVSVQNWRKKVLAGG
jgi:hypothetical protein